MTLSDFRKDKTLIREAMKRRSDPTQLAQLAVIKAMSPLEQPTNTVGMSSEDKAQQLGRIEGYNQCLHNFRLTMEEPKAPIPAIVSKFQPVAFNK